MFECVMVVYYYVDVVEFLVVDLNKVVGVCVVFDVFGVDDLFVFVMGDLKFDFDVMWWVVVNDCGFVVVFEYFLLGVFDYVCEIDELVFFCGDVVLVFWIVYVFNFLVD